MTTPCVCCGSSSQQRILSLGEQPLANSYLRADELSRSEPTYPLDVYVCEACWLMHIEPMSSPEAIFGDYAYFSSYSTTWLEHAARYVDEVTRRFRLHPASFVVEIASNDGYLLQHFLERSIPCLGIEPAANVADAARAKGIDTLIAFFGSELAAELAVQGKQADLIVGNNVLAHVASLTDFVAGLKTLLKPDGVITMEFPHLAHLIAKTEFDTIYHEHICYFALFVARVLFADHGLTVFDVDEIPTHGGSLRVYVRHDDDPDPSKAVSESVEQVAAKEIRAGLREIGTYHAFARRVASVKDEVCAFFDQARRKSNHVVGYGAPAKGNTLLNYCGLGVADLGYTVDRNPHKQGLFLPGSHVPICAPQQVLEDKPDYLFILPWNLRDEVMEQMQQVRDWGGKFVVPIPELQVLD